MLDAISFILYACKYPTRFTLTIKSGDVKAVLNYSLLSYYMELFILQKNCILPLQRFILRPQVSKNSDLKKSTVR